MTHIEAMKQALEAFCFMPNEIVTQSGVQVAMSSLRKAIAEAENARELGLNYKDQDTIEIKYRLKAQEDDVENTLHWHALNYRTALTENAQEMFEALENYVREKINENNQERKKLVGLTVEEIKECKFQSVNGTGWSTDIDIDQLAKNIEAKLKEKNT